MSLEIKSAESYVRIAHISDIHLMEHTRLALSVNALSEIAVDVRKRMVDFIVLTGDFSGRDAPHRLSNNERAAFAGFVRALSDVAPVIIIRGNHDSLGELRLFEKCRGENPITVFGDRQGVLHLLTAHNIGINFIAVPWMPMRTLGDDLTRMTVQDAIPIATERIAEFINTEIDKEEYNVVLMHGTVEGSAYSTNDGRFEISSPRDVIFPRNWFLQFPDVDYFALGHLHVRQQILPNVWYAGSPYPVDYSEKTPKGYLIVDIQKGKEPKVREVEVDSWRMLTVDAEWYAESTGDEGSWRTTPLAGMGRNELDNTFVKLRVLIPEHCDHTTIDFASVQTKVLSNGGFFSLDDVQIKRYRDKKEVSYDILLKETMQDKIAHFCKEKEYSPETTTQLLQRLEEINEHRTSA